MPLIEVLDRKAEAEALINSFRGTLFTGHGSFYGITEEVLAALSEREIPFRIHDSADNDVWWVSKENVQRVQEALKQLDNGEAIKVSYTPPLQDIGETLKSLKASRSDG